MSISSDSDSYRLMRDSASSCRLNAQHFLWKQACGFNLHPRLSTQADKEIKIADIGTGTGIWLLDVKPGTAFRVDGFDISLEQCPPPELCPECCTIRKLNILGEIPEDLRGIYDVVNVRLIQGGLKNDPIPALKNMITMLKPGGYLQWQEINISALSVTAAKPGLKQSSTEELLRQLKNIGLGDWTPRLADICTDNGLLDAKTDKYHVPPDLSIPFCQTQLLALEEISRKSMENSSPESNGPQFRASIEKTHAELITGVWMDHKLEVTVAKKAK